jgi:hypothetical protein
MLANKYIVLDNRPSGEAVASNFKLLSAAPPRCQMTRCWRATISSVLTPTCAGA